MKAASTTTTCLALLLSNTFAFCPIGTATFHSTQTLSSTALDASKRRDIFNFVKKTAVVGLGFLYTSEPAEAVDDSAVSGRIVEFTVNNLNGQEGKTGSFQIQMAPEWAPKGVARFEVSGNCCVVEKSSSSFVVLPLVSDRMTILVLAFAMFPPLLLSSVRN